MSMAGVRSNATQHAEWASELLRTVMRLDKELAELDADRRLQMIATGGMKRVNDDLRWSVDLAAAHALTATALMETLA